MEPRKFISPKYPTDKDRYRRPGPLPQNPTDEDLMNKLIQEFADWHLKSSYTQHTKVEEPPVDDPMMGIPPKIPPFPGKKRKPSDTDFDYSPCSSELESSEDVEMEDAEQDSGLGSPASGAGSPGSPGSGAGSPGSPTDSGLGSPGGSEGGRDWNIPSPRKRQAH